MSSIANAMITAAKELSDAVNKLTFPDSVAYVYNPLTYAWKPHEQYLKKYANGKKKVIFLGMNPGPWGMAQTGVPFGEISLVRDWVGVDAEVQHPEREHPKRIIEGFNCKRSEVSGRRLWGLFKERFDSAETFFKDHFVANYCPLVFMEESGKNLTPDKLPKAFAKPLYQACDQHLKRIVDILQPEWFIGVGGFAEKRIRNVLGETGVKIGVVLHPSPASPAANSGWSSKAVKQLKDLGVW